VWIYTGRLRYAGRRPTPWDSEVVLQASIEALANENVQVVLTTGHQDLPKPYLPLPPNFHFDPFVPGLAMARRSDLMIHHGGYGSCQTGLYVGIPQVIIPTLSERESNARRVLQQGAGEIILPTSDSFGTNKKVDPSDLAAKVRKVLSTPSYKENALRVSARLKQYGGAPKAAQLIEEYLAQKQIALGKDNA
jgi:UDP:flavonoid glycosyltransferase YjiC (YdhE family)